MKNRTGYCFVSISPVRKEPGDQKEMVTQLLFGELVEVVGIEEPWAKVITYSDRYEGFIDHKHIKFLSEKEVRRWMDGQTVLTQREIELKTPWGIQRICRGSFVTSNMAQFQIGNDVFKILNEKEDNLGTIFRFASDYLNTPYLWGGKSPYGIDCSGFTQIVYRIFGINLPRDAYEQAEHGVEIEFSECDEGDLAFFSNSEGRITHVGIIGPENKIIHAAGHVRIDILRSDGIYREDFDAITHRLSVIKRF